MTTRPTPAPETNPGHGPPSPEADHQESAACADGRQSEAALAIARGTLRCLVAHAFAALSEVPLASGRRADLLALHTSGELWIIEIKSSVADFRADQKWPEYRAYCDKLLFAVAPDFPVEILPPDTGLIVADRFGGEIVREAPEHRLSAARRKAVTVAIARIGALRLSGLADPNMRIDGLPRG
jgi:hypothetical protein